MKAYDHWFLKPRYIFLAMAILVVVYQAYAAFVQSPQAKASLTDLANDVIALCSGVNYRPTCYEDEIPKLMSDISMEDAFKVTSLVQNKDREYTYCHVLAHNLSAEEIKKDPDGWKDVVIRCPSGMCSNGCLHGGFQERFRAETFTQEEIEHLVPDLKTLCEPRNAWNPTGLEQGSCYHALGHLTMYLTNAEINQSIPLCERVAKQSEEKDYRQLCYDGAFMQIFQPLEPEDFSLIAGKEVAKDELGSFCQLFEDKKRSSCWTEGWPLFREQLLQPQGLVDYCANAASNDPDRCYDVLIYVITAQFQLDPQKMEVYCSGLPQNRSGRCFANASTRMIETDYRNIDNSVELCRKAEPYDENSECYRELLKYSRYNFHADSESFMQMCNSMPSPWKTKCLNKE
jgi:hypothetical protein